MEYIQDYYQIILRLWLSNGGVTENKSKPDFIFPSIGKYHDANFIDTGLSMLASKSTCKDRWRQVLSEAKRILVLPNEVRDTYTNKQKNDILNLKDFIYFIKTKQINFC
jgi:hypothetical protein